MRSKYIKITRLNSKRGIPHWKQLEKIKEMFPDLEVLKNNGNSFEIIIKLRPTPISKVYDIKICFHNSGRVKVYVIDEKLEVAKNREKLPHVYSHEEQRLCLYSPIRRQWTNHKLITLTIIPWASEWLQFYELWIPSGEWLGGGHNEYSDPDENIY